MAQLDDLPTSLKSLVRAWRMSGATHEEIIDRLDQLDLLAEEERLTLIEYAAATP